MAHHAMTLAEPAAPTVTPDQLELIRNTIARDASPDELRLYLYDCSRQGVHPLDKLIHFTKRGGKYTPITSIDLMRMRAADTGEYAGNERYVFNGTPGTSSFVAVSTVWRLVAGTRSNFTREARWSEYCPPPGQDHMWRKMPHIMLGKCAEAQALRAGFPRQLHGLYAAEELQQADGPPPQTVSTQWPVAAVPSLEPAPAEDDPALPAGFVHVADVAATKTKNPKVTRYLLTLSTGETTHTVNALKASLAEKYRDKRTPVKVTSKPTQWGPELVSIETADDLAQDAADRLPDPPPPVEDQPF